jgi:uncharacterized damage-inducible protein DinB
MRTSLRTVLIAAGLIIIASPRSFAQTAPIKSEVQKDWVGMKDTMMKISAEMPEDKFGYKSTPAQRSYGEQILHVATANVGFLRGLNGKAAAPNINAKATAKAEILKALSDSFDYGTALIEEQTPESMLQTVQARFLGESTRARIYYFLIGHAWDIYGQMAVYLRLNGQVPPASQRP